MGFGKNHMICQRVRNREGDVSHGRQIFMKNDDGFNNEDDSHDLLLLHDVIELSFVSAVLTESPPAAEIICCTYILEIDKTSLELKQQVLRCWDGRGQFTGKMMNSLFKKLMGRFVSR